MEKTHKILEKYRNEKNLTQEQLSQLTGVSRSFLSHLLVGNKRAGKKTLEKICQVLEIKDEDVKKIEFYEEFVRTPDKFQDAYYVLLGKLEKAERKNENFEGLDELDAILTNYYQKKFMKDK